METPTVTPAASVAAPESTQEFSVQESLNKATSAELDHWQKTGELPGEKKTTPAAANDTAKGDDKTQAASSTAPTQEKTQQRTPRTSENRWQKLSRELRESRAENERLKANSTQQQPAKTETPRDTTAETRSAQPAAAAKTAGNARPKLDDVDEKGTPKYKTYTEYETAKDNWLKEEAKRELREENSQTEQQKAQAAAKTRVSEEIQKRVEQARKDYTDYDEVVATGTAAKDDAGREMIFIPEGSYLQDFFLDSDRGQDVLYEILKDPEAHAAIFARNEKGDRFLMTPVRQLRELAKIEVGLKPKTAAAGDGKATPGTPRTPAKLPPPPTELGARNSAPADEAEAALARGDTKAYMRIVNQREIKARSK